MGRQIRLTFGLTLITIAILATITTKAQTPAIDRAVMKFRIDSTYYLGKNNLRPGTPGYNPIYHTAEQATLKALVDYVYDNHLWDSAHGVPGSGTVITVTANITPTSVYSATVTNPTTSPNIQIAMVPAPAKTLLGNASGSSGVPAHFAPQLTVNPFGSEGTSVKVLHGNASGAFTWGPVVLTTDVQNTLREVNGGTNQSTYAKGDILYATGADTLGRRAIGAGGKVLRVNAALLPEWQDPEVGAANTVTFTNKRWVPRVSTTTTVSATPSFNTDNYDIFEITAQNANITNVTTNISGTPANGEVVGFKLTAASGSYTIAWGTKFVNSTVSMPTTITTTTQTVYFQYCSSCSQGTNVFVCAKTY